MKAFQKKRDASAGAIPQTPTSPTLGSRPVPAKPMLDKDEHPLLRIQRALLTAMELPADKADEVVRTVSMHWNRRDVETRPMGDAVQTALNHIVRDSTYLLGRSKRSQAAIKIQALQRGRAVRERYHLFKTQPNVKPRNQAIFELVSEEEKYIDNLEMAVAVYLKALRQSAGSKSGPISTKDVDGIFGNFESILAMHIATKQSFAQMLDHWPCIDGRVGLFFLRMIPTLEVYSEYVTAYPKASVALTMLQKNDKAASAITGIHRNAKFDLALADGKKEKAKVLTLEEYLRLPLERISKYVASLSNIQKHTPAGHDDAEALEEACAILAQTAETITNSLKQAAAAAEVQSVQQRLQGIDESLLKNRATLLREGPVVLHDAKEQRQRYLLLLDNLLVIAKEKDSKLKYKSHAELKEVTVADIRDTKMFDLQINKKSHKFEAPSAGDKLRWMKDLEFLTITCKVFGVELDEVLSRENHRSDIPFVVQACADAVRKKGIDYEGIFRQSGDSSEIQRIKDSFNSGQSVDLAKNDPYAVACVLKLWFRELPVPLFPFDVYESFLAAGVNQRGLSKGVLERKLRPLRNHIENLPHANRNLLRYLMLFLNEVATHSAHNKMAAANLAIVFAPNLLRPAVESVSSALQIPMVNSAIMCIIDNASFLFPAQ